MCVCAKSCLSVPFAVKPAVPGFSPEPQSLVVRVLYTQPNFTNSKGTGTPFTGENAEAQREKVTSCHTAEEEETGGLNLDLSPRPNPLLPGYVRPLPMPAPVPATSSSIEKLH